jgi:hypothetical protein
MVALFTAYSAAQKLRLVVPEAFPAKFDKPTDWYSVNTAEVTRRANLREDVASRMYFEEIKPCWDQLQQPVADLARQRNAELKELSRKK